MVMKLSLKLHMINEIRSLNLSNSVAIVLYEALRQNHFDHMQLQGQHINVISTEGVGTEFIFTLEKAK